MESKGLEAYYGKDIFLSEALTLETIKVLDTAASSGKPFFLYMPHYAVHTPYKPDNRFYQKYIDKGYARNEAMYESIVEDMDKSLGDLMDYVERKEIADNTIILFMSDNGGLALTPPRDGDMYSQNAPLRSGKGSLYEGGIREPMLAYWPGITKAGSVNNQYLIIEDFFPTILQMAGIKKYNTVQTIDGKSFVKGLKKPSIKDTNRVLVWHFPSSWEQGDQTIKKQSKGMRVEQQGMGPASAIRKVDWKLIYFYGTAETELYDLKNDIGEHKNLVKQYPAVVRRLTEILYQKLKETNAQFPVNVSTGKNIYPGAEKEITRIN